MIATIRKNMTLYLCAWTVMLLAIYGAVTYFHHNDTIQESVNEARHYHSLNRHYRAWNSSIGGVYADASKVRPNPYLTLPDRDVAMSDGKRYTLVNPAYMTRMVFDALNAVEGDPVISKLTSLKHLNPANAPDEWEAKALRVFEQKEARETFEQTTINGKPYLRYISPFITETGCLKCHADQGYKAGDIRGGISIAIPLGKHLLADRAIRINMAFGLCILWVLGSGGIVLTGRRQIQQAKEIHSYRNQLLDKIHDLELSHDHIRQLSEKLSIVMDGIPAMIAHVDREQRFLYANRAYAEWVGISGEEIPGKTVREVIGEEAYQVSSPYIDEVLRGKVGELERSIDESGTRRYQSIRYIPQWNDRGGVIAYFAFITDVTDRKVAEAALQESNERFASAFVNSPAMMAITSRDDCRCLDVNQRFLEVSGLSRDEMIGRSLVDLGWFTSVQQETFLDEVLTTGTVGKRELSHRTGSGRELFLDYSGQLIPIGGETYLLFIMEDVTEQRAVKQQLFHAQKMEAVGQLAGGIAHDFNNLLQVINTFGFLVQQQLTENRLSPQFAEEIVKAGNRAADLTSGLLAFSRKQALDPKRIDINRLIRDTHKLLSRVISENIDFVISYHPEPLTVMADGGQIQQILINLATNARDAMPGGGTLTIDSGRAEIDDAFINRHGFGTAGRYATITVTDTGSGMDSETRDRIFEPFFTTKPLEKGTGLGLAIVYGIVSQHNGYITVDSESGAGTVFRIYLPEAASPADEGEHDRRTAQLPKGNETVLVVDDEEMVRSAIGSTLTAHGYRVLEAGDGVSALEMLRVHGSEISLVIMDLVMPVMGGLETIDRMRSRAPALPVLFISGYSDDSMPCSWQQDERTVLLAKPFHPEKLLETVRALLGRQGAP